MEGCFFETSRRQAHLPHHSAPLRYARNRRVCSREHSSGSGGEKHLTAKFAKESQSTRTGFWQLATRYSVLDTRDCPPAIGHQPPAICYSSSVQQIRKKAWLLVLFSAALQILSFPLPSLYFLSWIALTPLL